MIRRKCGASRLLLSLMSTQSWRSSFCGAPGLAADNHSATSLGVAHFTAPVAAASVHSVCWTVERTHMPMCCNARSPHVEGRISAPGCSGRRCKTVVVPSWCGISSWASPMKGCGTRSPSSAGPCFKTSRSTCFKNLLMPLLITSPVLREIAKGSTGFTGQFFGAQFRGSSNKTKTEEHAHSATLRFPLNIL